MYHFHISIIFIIFANNLINLYIMASGIAHKHLYPIMTDMPKECYKVIVKTDDGKFLTVSHPTEITNDVITGLCPWVAKDEGSITSCIYKGISRWILGGFIHTYSNINSAVEKRNALSRRGKNAVIFKCEIPINTEYYDCEMNDYMSKQIIFLSEVNI